MTTTPENWQQVLADAGKAISEAKKHRRYKQPVPVHYQNRPQVFGVPVVVVPKGVLPLGLSPGEEARRIVRHGLADVLRWLKEDVGPSPDDRTHVLYDGVSGTLLFSKEAFASVYDNMWAKFSNGW